MEQNTLFRGRITGLVGNNEEKSLDGCVVVAPLSSDGKVYLVNNDGKKVHEWNVGKRPGRHARILPNGNLAFNGVYEDSPKLFDFWEKYRGGYYAQISPSGEIVHEHIDPLGHHDCHHYGDGRLLYTTLEPLTGDDAARVLGGVPNTEGYNGSVYADIIKEVDAQGNTTWEWHVSEKLPRDLFPLQSHYNREHWPLINSVWPLKDGNILASLRSVSAVIVIERSTGDIIWHLDSTVVAQQHNAHELDNGNFLIFDNGAFRHRESFQFSRVIEVSRATKEIVWSYTDRQPEAFYSPFMGSAQRLPNGNTFICESAFGRLFEVTPEREIVWEYLNPYRSRYPASSRVSEIFKNESSAMFRAYKYEKSVVAPYLK